MPTSSKLPLKKKTNTVHNPITFSIVFTNNFFLYLYSLGESALVTK